MKLKLAQGRYSLYDKRGRGDSGYMIKAICRKPSKDTDTVGENGVLEAGKAIMCGSGYARTFGSDWWLTTHIVEFKDIEYNDDGEVVKCVAVTENDSEYTVEVV